MITTTVMSLSLDRNPRTKPSSSARSAHASRSLGWAFLLCFLVSVKLSWISMSKTWWTSRATITPHAHYHLAALSSTPASRTASQSRRRRRRRAVEDDASFTSIVPKNASMMVEEEEEEDASSFFLHATDYRRKFDMFAAAWWQSVDRLVLLPTDKIQNNVHVVFGAMNVHDQRDVRLTRDWLDLSVEHLSKWYKIADYTKYDASFYVLADKLWAYVSRVVLSSSSQSHQDWSSSSSWVDETNNKNKKNPWRDTLALVGYSPLGQPAKEGSANNVKATALDTIILAAQIASLVQYQCGRIVVATHLQEPFYSHVTTQVWPVVVQLLQGETPAAENHYGQPHWAEQYQQLVLQQQLQQQRELMHALPNATTTMGNTTIYIGQTELILVGVDTTDNPSVPRQAMRELHAALLDNNLNEGPHHHNLRRQYLGETPSSWKYVYYTEQGSPLLSRPTAWPRMQQAMDNGLLLLPHRWQPIPHASDLQGKTATSTMTVTTTSLRGNNGGNRSLPVRKLDLPPTHYLPALGNWTTVTSVSVASTHAACCDLGMASEYATLDYEKCHTLWYQCGFGGAPTDDRSEIAHRLRRMERYRLIRLVEGTNLTLLAASEHARQCQPVTLSTDKTTCGRQDELVLAAMVGHSRPARRTSL